MLIACRMDCILRSGVFSAVSSGPPRWTTPRCALTSMSAKVRNAEWYRVASGAGEKTPGLSPRSLAGPPDILCLGKSFGPNDVLLLGITDDARLLRPLPLSSSALFLCGGLKMDARACPSKASATRRPATPQSQSIKYSRNCWPVLTNTISALGSIATEGKTCTSVSRYTDHRGINQDPLAAAGDLDLASPFRPKMLCGNE
mmetsp:Transcript_31332/g.81358  ORF Transcript_31332/g.81358 Transcript_31332/m.81358 type:complete len:201 (-) Transcript_31332:1325-1927(-)